MARVEDRSGWLSLPEAAEAVRITLPALRYLSRRLAFALGAVQDDRGETYLPSAGLESLRRVVSYRSQGLELDQIERLLLERSREIDARSAEMIEHDPRAVASVTAPPPPAPDRPSRLRPPAETPQGEHSLPFPFTPVGRGGSRRSRTHGPGARRELPFPSNELRRELAALRDENRELRERLDELIAWLRAREGTPTAETSRRGPETTERRPSPLQRPERAQQAREPGPVARRVTVATAEPADEQAGRPPAGTRLTRTPSGNVRPAVVRNWHPPALNGDR